MWDALTLFILMFIYENKVIYLEVVNRLMNLVTPRDKTRRHLLKICPSFSEETT